MNNVQLWVITVQPLDSDCNAEMYFRKCTFRSLSMPSFLKFKQILCEHKLFINLEFF